MLYFKNKPYDVIPTDKCLAVIKPYSDRNYLYFQAVEGGAYLYFVTQESYGMALEYSTDGSTWTTWTYSVSRQLRVFDTIVLSNPGNYVFLRASSTNTVTNTVNGYNRFVLGPKKILSGGNIISLLDKTLPTNYQLNAYQFYKLFENCASLTAAPELPSTTLANYCYYYMFQGCTSLATAPELPATTLAQYCYSQMFNGCTALRTAPELPATTLALYCYQQMFDGCTALATAPELPATKLVNSCYRSMFHGCTSLTTAPELHATTLASNCYYLMFDGCASLTTAPELPATKLESYCYCSMFRYCSSLTTAPELPATKMATYCYYQMFCGCTSLATAPELPATTLANGCYNGMFYECRALTVAPLLPASTLFSSCYSSMFRGCTSLTKGADMQTATTLASSCCTYMYYGCTNLSSAYTPNINSWTPSYFSSWLYGVASTGTLYKPNGLDMTSYVGVNGIPQGWTSSILTKTITLSAGEYSFTYKINNGSAITVQPEHSISETLTIGDVLTIQTQGFEHVVICNGKCISPGTTVGVDISYDEYFSTSVFTTEHVNMANSALVFESVSGGDTVGMAHYGTNQTTTKPLLYVSTDGMLTWSEWDHTSITLSNQGDTAAFVGFNTGGISSSSTNYSTFTLSTSTGVHCHGNTMSIIDLSCKRSDVPSYCFYNLFSGCDGLLEAPGLPATTLADMCYYQMFFGCTSLATAPELPATVLANHCYLSMFHLCESLTTAPVLPATILAYSCYRNMFIGCTSLNYIYTRMTDITAGDALLTWVSSVSPTGDFYCDASLSIPTGNNGIPNGWTRHDI